ncbi:hypothetical protein JCM10908_006600 [Rhodotorula pacifica]|uniref:Tms1p n=1 Tax=Rhodotorula pacifica TaxID=1495444 RepID=UPI00316FFC02
MGLVASIPLLGSLAGLSSSAASACVTGAVWFCTGQAASALTRSCNCNSSVATRVGFSLIFLANSLLAWIMLSDWAIKQIAKYSYDWIKMDCNEGKCYGVLAVHRICFALAMFHAVLSLLLIGVKDTRTKRAAIQNGWWGPKVLAWLVLVYVSFLVPNGFFTSFWATYVSLPGSAIFILIGLVLLVDFAHSWSETCLERWESTDAPLWKWILIGSTLGLYALTIALTVVQYVFFGGKGCGLNTVLITTNWVVSLLLSALSIAPAVQESNPRSGLAQSGMVVAYTSYLITSAIANHDDGEGSASGRCNPLQSRAAGARTGMVVLGAVFTFLAIAYSTSRAATQSKAFAPGSRSTTTRPESADYEALSQQDDPERTASPMGDLNGGAVRTQPRKQDSLRWQAIKAAIDEGSLPPSALTEFENEDDSSSDDDTVSAAAPVNDDERSGTRYNYSFFHVIFVLATMYTACLLTNWSVVSPITNSPNQGTGGDDDDGQPMRIGRSHVAFWMRVISSWVSQALYAWSLGAPLIWPDRFEASSVPASPIAEHSTPAYTLDNSRPASPTGHERASYAYPQTPDLSYPPSMSANSSPAPSRSGSHSKDPLLKRQRASINPLKQWLTAGGGGGRHLSATHELEERGRRRLSNSQVEANPREAVRRMASQQSETFTRSSSGKAEKGPWWKISREMAQRIVGFGMIALVGMNDSATGANLDSMQEFYHVDYDKISIVFLANTAGYFLSSMSSSFMLHHFGLQTSLLVACAGMSIGCVVLSIAPPFPAFIVMLMFMGFGSGMYDACITIVVAHEEDGVLMSLLYSCFGLGAMISPLAIGAFLDRGYAWNRYYNIPLGISLLLAVIGFFVFRGYIPPPDETHDAPLSTAQAPGSVVHDHTTTAHGEVVHARSKMSAQQRMKRAFGIRAVWVGIVLIVLAFASTDILSAWSVSFLLSKRSAPAASSRYVLSGLWGGIATGRVVLAWALANRLGEKTFAILMLGATSAILAVLYVRNFVVDAVALALVGFFMGPVTPKILAAIGVRVPPSLKGSVVSLLVGTGLLGSSVGPLLFGVVAGRGGLSSLPAVMIGVSAFSIGTWLAVPKNRRRED